MYSLGKYKLASGEEYNALVNHKKSYLEIILYTDTGAIVSAYKKTDTYEGAAVSKLANDLARSLTRGIASCNSKNGVPVAFVLGSCSKHTFKKSNINYEISKFNNELCGAYITTEMFMLELDYCDQNVQIPTIEYVEYTHKSNDNDLKEASGEDDIPVRSLDEIALEKDLTWLKDKKYFVVNDEQTAEQIFSYLDNYNNTISFDTETTGLKINMFCQIGSDKKKEIEEYNAKAIANGKNPVRTDKLVGFIYCIEPNVSYYFPCFNRKFKNLYEDVNEPVTRKTVTNILASYTIGEYRDRHDFMAEFIRNTPPEQWGPDVILMERNRKILSTKNLLAHNGTFEWKVCWNYWIDFHLVDDTIILHQLMYKFRSTTRNSGEPSNLKYLSKRELGVDQLELTDFFDGFSEDDSGKATGAVRKGKKANVKIDFSYMDYDGSRAYAPADGDLTLELFLKYKPDLIKNHKELEYLYAVEILVAQAIGYMEYYGHRIDPVKIDNIHKKYVADKISIEYKIRDLINYNTPEEKEVYSHIEETNKQIDELDKAIDNIKKENPEDSLINELKKERDEQYKFKESLQTKLVELFENSENQLNLASPAQVAELFYDKLQIPCSEEKKSVNKKIVKGLLKAKNEDGSMKYPVVDLYSKWKNTDTYITKFFGNLPDYMYPGGYIFSSFGQISTATGRMSCIEENTPITVVGGTKPIKDIKAGDMVYCYDNEGELRIKKVTNVMDNGYRDCIKLHWRSTGAHENGELICTPDHRILTKDRGWVKARELKYGDRVYSLRQSNEDQITNNNDLNNHMIIGYESVGVKHVYDLEVEDCHNFIANEICVHNCKKPNAQQYPKAVTAIVNPRPGFVMVDADFSQIEYRTLVALANEQDLLNKFKDPDMDYHTTMASLMYGVSYASVTPKQRGDAKSFNFGIPYGMGFGSLAILLTGINNETTRAEAMEKYELYFKDQPHVRQYFKDVKEFANVRGYTETKWGRRRYYSFVDKDGNFSQAKKAQALRQAGNAIIQGCLDGDTRIQTKEFGIVKIKDVVNRHLMVWDGDKWSNGDILYSGKKQKCIVTFTTGQKFICSPIHKFLVRSAKGNDRFVECKDLRGSVNSTNPSRVVVNPEYVESDFTYNSKWAYDYMTFNHQSNNALLEQVGDSFRIGEILGRLASDGSIFNREVGGKFIRHIIAEHEYNILPELRNCMEKLGFIEKNNDVREDRNQKITYLDTYSESLVNEIDSLDVKHQIHDNIFMDTEVLRGFIRGCFDGDGGLCGNAVRLVFGEQFDFEPMCRDIQKALLFFGIRSRYKRYKDRYVIDISTYDNKRFAELIGFINTDKQEKLNNTKCVRDEHIFGRCLNVESVEITDEYIDMYDVCNTDGGYYVADGIITHNTAADIFKIGVARNFAFIRKNNLFGKMIIVNMIHDEQLIEADARCLDIKAVVAALVQNMEMKIDGFPPLYVGAGVGLSWKDAKGKMNEINPKLAHQFIEEAKNISIFTDKPKTPKEVLDYFNKRVYEFRRDKIIDYVKDEKNYHQTLHPVIGNLLSLQFDYGVNAEFDAKYTEDNGYTKDEIAKAKKLIPLEQLKRFLADMGINDIDTQLFMSEEDLKAESEVYNEEPEEEEEYTDGDEEEDDDLDSIEQSGGEKFELFDESDKASLYGVDMKDLIGEFGLLVSKKLKVCGIDATKVRAKFKESMSEYLKDHVSENEDADTDSDSLELVFLMSNNIVKHTGGYVKNIRQKELARACGLNPDMF